ncbi:hypothetical protein [Saccharopolyspora pogona]|uniref:hypothetical protein n=1 Tax=Saccharopolyspora pogona TaxID=333966 RepID=UPI001682BCD6|nr:hypothetical protein [Saccharopolyspora pogona]
MFFGTAGKPGSGGIAETVGAARPQATGDPVVVAVPLLGVVVVLRGIRIPDQGVRDRECFELLKARRKTRWGQ